jgi:hypothetical protein
MNEAMIDADRPPSVGCRHRKPRNAIARKNRHASHSAIQQVAEQCGVPA